MDIIYSNQLVMRKRSKLPKRFQDLKNNIKREIENIDKNHLNFFLNCRIFVALFKPIL